MFCMKTVMKVWLCISTFVLFSAGCIALYINKHILTLLNDLVLCYCSTCVEQKQANRRCLYMYLRMYLLYDWHVLEFISNTLLSILLYTDWYVHWLVCTLIGLNCCDTLKCLVCTQTDITRDVSCSIIV